MKLKKGFIILVVLFLFIGIGCYIYFSFFGISGSSVKRKTIDSIDEYGYTLNNNDTDVYKNYFDELKSVLNSDSVDENKYLELISKMFIIELYSLDLKTDNNDIGGVQFVYEDVVDNYKAKVQDTLYLYIESNLYGKRDQNLPVVSDVFINDVSTVAYYYNDNKDVDNNAYQVKVSWDYIEDLDYETEAVLYFIHDKEKLSLVEIK